MRWARYVGYGLVVFAMWYVTVLILRLNRRVHGPSLDGPTAAFVAAVIVGAICGLYVLVRRRRRESN